MVDSEDRYSTEKASSVQSSILYDCDAEALSNSIRPSQSYSPTIKWRCCSRLVQFHGFRSVEVLLDTPPGSPKNSPEARGGSVRVQITLSRPVNFFMVKPRLCPRQDQSIPVQSRRPLGFGQVFSDQPAASCLEHCELVCLNSTWNLGFPLSLKIVSQREAGLSGDPKDCGLSRGDPKDCGPRSVLTLSPKVVDIKAMRFPLLEARSWQEAKSNLVTVALARHVALPDHGVGLDGQSCSCLIVGWPVGLSSPTLGVGRPSVMFLFDCWPVGRPMLRTVRGCYRGGMKTLKWREFEAKPKPEVKEWRQIQRTGQWYGLDRWEETKLRWERTSSVVGETKIEKMVGLIRNEHGQDRIRAMSVLWQSKRKRMT
ncbi:hypothetical protein YC2023_004410 [Brassica napus]